MSTVALALVCFALAVFAASALVASLRLRSAHAELERETETLRDAVWEANDREEQARREGEHALQQAEARAEAGARAKTKFLATVTHEMRTPLSGVIGTTELLLETALAPAQQTYARAVKQSAEAMLSLVDEILDLSRLEADRIALNDAPFEVVSLVESVVELLAPRAHQKGLDLAVHVGGALPSRLIGDAARIRQVLLNLAGNALKFTTSGGVGLRVDAVGAAVRFSVIDTGPGFAQADAERLFEEFERNAADPGVGGVGLGLAISRRIADAMGGSLDAVGAIGEGATFVLTLPLRMAPDAVAGEEKAPLAGRRVAVVSSAPFSGPWLTERLEELGAISAQFQPTDMLEAAVRSYDTVVIDRGSASDASEPALAARRAGANRILLLLSPSERHELSTLASKGFDGYLVKPVRASSLVSRLEDPQAAQSALVVEAGGPVAFPLGAGPKVLLAEDDPVSALIALAHLARLGCSALHVADGLAACDAFEAETFDAALLDLRMPGLDGCGAARRMRSLEEETGRKPCLILAVSANGAPDDRAAALASGMNHLLAKPLDRKALQHLLEPVLQNAKAA